MLEIKNAYEFWSEHFFINDQGRRQGEYTSHWPNKRIRLHCFYNNGSRHGEYKFYLKNGGIHMHCFFVAGCPVSFKEIPYPTTNEDHLYFRLKYDLPLLPVETKC